MNERILPVRSISDELAATEKICQSPLFSNAPQLQRFLRFVVERTLENDQKSIKAYTIGVEALGRPVDFDPDEDFIVRVEAVRLRKALEEYYRTAGAGSDGVRIRMPVGHYIPTFERHTATGSTFIPPVADARFGAFKDPSSTVHSSRIFHGSVIEIEPFLAVGAPRNPIGSFETLRMQLVDAFTRFDAVTILANDTGATTASSNQAIGNALCTPDFLLKTIVDVPSGATMNLTFSVVDQTTGGIIWTRIYGEIRIEENLLQLPEALLQEVATALLDADGIIHARARIHATENENFDPRYSCWLEASFLLRQFDSRLYDKVRSCLESELASDPNFVAGYVQLAQTLLYEYQVGIGSRKTNSTMLDHARELAKRAIDLQPQNASAHSILMRINLVQGEFEGAILAANRSADLNPYDGVANLLITALRILLGDLTQGDEILRQHSRQVTVWPPVLDFMLFLASYASEEWVAVLSYAGRLVNRTDVHGLLARTLLHVRTGDRLRACKAFDKLTLLAALWRDDPVAAFSRIAPIPVLAARIEADLAIAAGWARRSDRQATGARAHGEKRRSS